MNTKSFKKKISGWKVLKIKMNNNEEFYDIALFGEKSLIVEGFQLCENIVENVPYEKKKEIKEIYGTELPLNFINDAIIIL